MLGLDLIWVDLSTVISFPIVDAIDNRDFFANKSGDNFGREIQITVNVVSSLRLYPMDHGKTLH